MFLLQRAESSRPEDDGKMMKIVLPLLSVTTLYAAFYFAYINGLHGLALKSIESRTLPGRSDPLRTVYTEVPLIDRLLTALTVFFWPAADGSNPTLTLHSVGFAGTFGSAWILLTLESWRRGNAWTIVALYVHPSPNLSKIREGNTDQH